jgi:hypothetical protein
MPTSQPVSGTGNVGGQPTGSNTTITVNGQTFTGSYTGESTNQHYKSTSVQRGQSVFTGTEGTSASGMKIDSAGNITKTYETPEISRSQTTFNPNAQRTAFEKAYSVNYGYGGVMRGTTPGGQQFATGPRGDIITRSNTATLDPRDIQYPSSAYERYANARIYGTKWNAQSVADAQNNSLYKQLNTQGIYGGNLNASQIKQMQPSFQKYANAGVYGTELSASQIKALQPGPIKQFVNDVIPESLPKFFSDYAKDIRGRPSFRAELNAFFDTVRTGQRASAIESAPTGIARLRNEIYPAGLEFASGYTKELRDNPERTLANTAIFFALPGALKAVGTAGKFFSSKTPALIQEIAPAITETLSKTAGITIPTIYGVSVASRVALSDTPNQEFGKIAASEISPMIVGGYLGTQFFQRTTGAINSLFRKGLPTENLVSEPIRTGKVMLDTYNPKKHYDLFVKAKNPFDTPVNGKSPLVVLHAASGVKTTAMSEIARTGKGSIGVGPDYLPGGFVAPSDKAAVLFLGIGKGNVAGEWYSSNIFNPYSSPKLMAIYPKGIRNRASTSTGESSLSGQPLRKFKGTDKLGVVDIPRIKSEPEGILPPGTRLQRIARDFFFTWKGVRIPIDEFKVVDPDSEPIKGAVKTFGRFSSEYTVGRTSVMTPASFIAASSLKKSSSSIAKSSLGSSASSLKSSSPVLSSSLRSSSSSVTSSTRSSSVRSSLTSSSSSSSGSSSSSSASSSASSFGSSSSSKGGSSSSRSGSSWYPSSSSVSPPPSERKSYGYSSGKSTAKKKKRGAFQALAKRRGRWFAIGRPTERAEALDIGTAYSKRTLGASFKVIGVDAFSENVATSGEFQRFREQFRDYKVRGNQKIPLKDEFIQRRSFRLSTPGEKAEIKSAKFLKSGVRKSKKGWF